MAPSGEFVERPDVHARTGLLLHTTGGRLQRLVDGRLPEGLAVRELRAVLRNPGTEAAGDRAQISNAAVVTFDR